MRAARGRSIFPCPASTPCGAEFADMIVKVIPLDCKPLQGGPQPDALAEVIVGDGQKFIGIQEGRAAEADAPFLGEPYPLCLPRPDLFPLVLRHERQHLRTTSAINLPTSESDRTRVSRSGMSSTRISAPISFVILCHSSMIRP